MYAYIQGILIEATPHYAILEASGVGYYVAIPVHTFSRLPQLGEKAKLFTSFVVRENSQALFGFLTQAEKQLFETLLDVSGIGPKLALSIAGHLPPEALLGAIQRNDIPLLTKVPGIGKKTAERIILDLRDKTKNLFAPSPIAYQIPSQLASDALSALINLGYSETLAQKAVAKTLNEGEELPLGDFITRALKNV